MKKIISFLFVLLLGLLPAGCSVDTTLQKANVYPLTSDIRFLDVQINAADFTIMQAETFSVESNLKHLSVSEKNGVLTIIEQNPNAFTYTDAMLTLYIPAGTEFEQIKITTGAAKLTADTLSAKLLTLQLGAGDVHIENLNASSRAEIQGGAGQITVTDGILHNLDLDMGVGELNLTAALLGDSDLALGVGASNLTLIGSTDDYRVDIENSLSRITVNGITDSRFSTIGNGHNHVEIEGGVGAIDLNFQE